MCKKMKVDDLKFIRKLGQGGFGSVLFAQHLPEQKFYAVKVYSKKVLVEKKLVECIERERELMVQLEHPFIINLAGFCKDSRLTYLVMECATGGDLHDHLKAAKTFPTEQAKFYAAQMVLTLAHLREHHILHRDLKPENLLMCPNGYLKLCDFGLAKQLGPGKRAYTFCGTPNYMAPEILQNKPQSVAVDWWCLGVLIYQMIVGRTPWQSRDDSELYKMILDGKMYFPSYMEKNCKSLLKHLCIADLSMRYGDLKNGPDDIASHEWFSDIEWEQLLNMEIPAPFKPNVVNDSVTSNFQLDPELRDAPSLTGSEDPFVDW